MAKGVLIVHSNPVDPSRDDEFNQWYDNVHVPDVKKVPGIVGARRFKTLGPGATHRYVAIYEIDADDVGGVMEAMGKASANGELPLSDVLAMPPVLTLCEQV
ncbi:MAG TPA: hypothetical protein VKQ71_07360 [Acidimicrobiales bacterium]|nr:hypothetical protein [Acidimicrobiales bacterium]